MDVRGNEPLGKREMPRVERGISFILNPFRDPHFRRSAAWVPVNLFLAGGHRLLGQPV